MIASPHPIYTHMAVLEETSGWEAGGGLGPGERETAVAGYEFWALVRIRFPAGPSRPELAQENQAYVGSRGCSLKVPKCMQ